MRWMAWVWAVVLAAGCASESDSPGGGGSPRDDAGAGGAGGSGAAGGAGEGGQGGTGGAPEPRTCPDRDRDNYQAREPGCRLTTEPDCDDRNNLIRPERDDNCANRIDDDCDGRVNDGCDEQCGDFDNDGFRDAACDEDRRTGGDCNDMDATVNPGAGERCGNFRDDNCDGRDVPCLANCTDMDLDGFGEGSGCYGADCDDTDANLNPWASERCGDRVDQDCDGEDLVCRPGCTDRDKDGFGEGEGCPAEDCNDTDPDINPAAVDLPGDMIDQDCSGADTPRVQNCDDLDRDAHGEGPGCLGPDCDDADPRVNAARIELCGNRRDDDCDDRDVTCTGMGQGECVDEDGDGYGEGACPRGDFDCDDDDDTVNPGAREVCNDKDDNCNEEVDECPRRNQACDGAACVGQAGAPCRADGECAANLGLHCNTDVGQCRVNDGEVCAESAQCNPSAECTLLDACDEETSRCYQAKGGPCADSCDCNDVWLCHDEAAVCVECTDDAHCGADGDARTTCTRGGFCAESVPLGGDVEDARIEFLRRAAACWAHFAESRETFACDLLLPEAPLLVDGQEVERFGGDIDAEQTYVCDHLDALGAEGFDEDARAVLGEVFGCGLFDLLNIWWELPIEAGTEVCLYYAPRKGGFPLPDGTRAAVVIERCALSVVE